MCRHCASECFTNATEINERDILALISQGKHGITHFDKQLIHRINRNGTIPLRLHRREQA